MRECQWPYPCIDKAGFYAKIAFVEKILQKYGAECIEDVYEKNMSIFSSGFYTDEKTKKHIWKKENEYIRIDRIYFADKPFLVLEFSERKEGPYEDSDPFPYDLPDKELEQEVRYSLGVETL